MKKLQNLYILGFILILSLSACSNTSDFDNQQKTIEQLSSKIDELSQTVSSLQEQLHAPEEILPDIYDGEQLYVNSIMPFAISLVNPDELPIKVYGYDSSIVIYYEDEDITQFIEGYGIVPRILIKENSTSPEYFDAKSIVRIIDNNWAIVRIISIETSLDGETNIKIRAMLDGIKFY